MWPRLWDRAIGELAFETSSSSFRASQDSFCWRDSFLRKTGSAEAEDFWISRSYGAALMRTYLREKLCELVGHRILHRLKGKRLVGARVHRLSVDMPEHWPPPLGMVNLGSFATTCPVSRDYGWDRGTPIDRHYIENFIAQHSKDISGHVLEVGDDAYSRKFGRSRVSRQDVLHIHAGNPRATIVGDLSRPGVL